MKSIRFTKMHGLGNDFILIDGIAQNVTLTKSLIKQWADRHYGIGFDQCLLLEASEHAEANAHFRIFNADGSEVAQCGNGARCAARFLHEQGLTKKNPITLLTQHQLMPCLIHSNGMVSVDISIVGPDATPTTTIIESNFVYANESLHFHTLNLGNPHAIIQVEHINQVPLAAFAEALLKQHPTLFPKGVNLSVMHRRSLDHIYLRVFERGAGETLACGSAACAAAAVAWRFYAMKTPLTVNLAGGTLNIEDKGDGNIRMTGPTKTVYEGLIYII
jgi:diaminopimelate epimerase